MQSTLIATMQGIIVQERWSLALLSVATTFPVFAQSLADSFPAFAKKLNVAMGGASMAGASATVLLCTAP